MTSYFSLPGIILVYARYARYPRVIINIGWNKTQIMKRSCSCIVIWHFMVRNSVLQRPSNNSGAIFEMMSSSLLLKKKTSLYNSRNLCYRSLLVIATDTKGPYSIMEISRATRHSRTQACCRPFSLPWALP